MVGLKSNNNELIYHKTVWDYVKINKILMATGFKKTRLWDWRITEHAHIDDHSQAYFPHMDKANGMQISINIEAVK